MLIVESPRVYHLKLKGGRIFGFDQLERTGFEGRTIPAICALTDYVQAI